MTCNAICFFIGLDHYSKTFRVNDSRTLNLLLFDTGGKMKLLSIAQFQIFKIINLLTGMERIASVTSSYYKFAEAAILVFAMDNINSFHSLSQHLVDITMFAETARIFLCGNKSDLTPEVTDEDIQTFCEQCHGLIQGIFKTSCKNNTGIDEMFNTIAQSLVESNRSRLELQQLEYHGFKVHPPEENVESCSC